LLREIGKAETDNTAGMGQDKAVQDTNTLEVDKRAVADEDSIWVALGWKYSAQQLAEMVAQVDIHTLSVLMGELFRRTVSSSAHGDPVGESWRHHYC